MTVVTSRKGDTCNLDNRMQEFGVESGTVGAPRHTIVYKQNKMSGMGLDDRISQGEPAVDAQRRDNSHSRKQPHSQPMLRESHMPNQFKLVSTEQNKKHGGQAIGHEKR